MNPAPDEGRPPPRRPAKPLLIWVGLALAVALIFALAVALLGRPGPDPEPDDFSRPVIVPADAPPVPLPDAQPVSP